MEDIKLQLGCLIIMLFFTMIYVRETYTRKIGCNRYFDLILYVAPWAIVFDGLTAWTVNRMYKLPYRFNLIAHGIFYSLMVIELFFAFLYMLDITVGIPKKKRNKVLIALPTVATLCLIFAFLPQVRFIQGDYTFYSMGMSVYICFVSLLGHFGAIAALVISKRRTIERRKRILLYFIFGMVLAILITQILLPEILISSLFSLIIVLGLYVCNEDPASKRLEKYGADMVMNFSTLVENRDHSTGGHIMRTQKYVAIMLKEMRKTTKYSKMMTQDYLKYVSEAAPMHDIGKIATPDSILQKPGKLTDEEFEIMKQHAPKGGEIIKSSFTNLDEPKLTQIVYEVARFHHEKWNGRGYPDGLKEEEIPLHARVMAIADVFDAVSAKRCYRDAMPLETCFKIIEEGSGRDFDPELVEIFMNAKDKIVAVYNEKY